MSGLKTFLKYLLAAGLGAAAYHCLCPCPEISLEGPEQVVFRNVVAEILPDTHPSPESSSHLAT